MTRVHHQQGMSTHVHQHGIYKEASYKRYAECNEYISISMDAMQFIYLSYLVIVFHTDAMQINYL